MAKTKVHGEYLDPSVISGQTQVTAVGADSVLILDATDNALKKALLSDVIETVADGDISTAKIADDAVTSAKLDTNIDIAGTFDVTGATTLDSTLNVAGIVGIGNTNASSFNSNSNNLVVGSGSGGEGITIYSANDNNAQIFFADGTTGDAAYRGVLRYAHDVDRFEFFTAGTIRAVLDSSGNLGIGTTSPSSLLHMESGNAHNKLSITSTASGGTGYDAVIDLLGSASNSEVQLNMGINGDADREQIKTYQSAMSFRTNNTESMRIDSSGNLCIGATSSSTKVTIQAADTDTVNSSANGHLTFYDDAPFGYYKIRIATTNRDLAFDGYDTDNSWKEILKLDRVDQRINAKGGIMFGSDTAAANTLDDYEEGNFTPIFACQGGTAPSSQTGTGQYTKIGDVVHLTGQINWSGAGSGGVNLRIYIPFNVISDSRAGMAIGLNSGVSYTSGHMLHLIPEINTNIIYIVSSPSDGSSHTHLNFNNVKNTGSTLFSFSGSFHTRD